MVHRTIPCSFKTENRILCLWFVLPICSFLGLGLNVLLVCYNRMKRFFILFVVFRYSEWVNNRYCSWRLNVSTKLTNHVVVHSLSFTHLYIWLSVYIFPFVHFTSDTSYYAVTWLGFVYTCSLPYAPTSSTCRWAGRPPTPIVPLTINYRHNKQLLSHIDIKIRI